MSNNPGIIEIVDSDDDEVQQAETVSRTASPEPQHQTATAAAEAQNDATDPDPDPDDHHDAAEEIISITRTSLPRRGDRPRPGAAATPAARRTRLRGALLPTLGAFYPQAELRVHRVGDPDPAADLRCRGEVLWAMRAVLDAEATYRVTMGGGGGGGGGEGGPCGAAPAPEAHMAWVRGWAAGAGGPRDLAADEIVGVLELGGEGLGGLMMFTRQTAGGPGSGWVLARQIPGRDYALEECLDVLQVPAPLRAEIRGFGPKRWVNGGHVPAAWVAKDLSVGQVVSKIRNIMRE